MLSSQGNDIGKSDLEIVKLLSVYDFQEDCKCEIKPNTKFISDLKKIEEKNKSMSKKTYHAS